MASAVARGARVARERGGLVDERVVQLAHPPRAPSGAAPTRNASRRGRPALSQPAAERPTRRSSSASRALKASPSGGIPRELVARDRVQLEQPAQERLRVVAREVAALDERDRVREVGERQPACEARAVRALGGVRGRDELVRSAAAQPPATPQLLGSGHTAEPR